MRKRLATTLVLSMLCSLPAQRAKADVYYAVENTRSGFLYFIYDSPSFITTTTTVPASQLLFLNPAGKTTTSVVFLPDSTLYPGKSEVDAFNSTPTIAEELRFYPADTFLHYGLTLGDENSFGYPVSALNVTNFPDFNVPILPVPEPSALALCITGLTALVGFGLVGRRYGRPNA